MQNQYINIKSDILLERCPCGSSDRKKLRLTAKEELIWQPGLALTNWSFLPEVI